jgi:hypothetical protein
MRIITPRVHGGLDYLMGLFLIFAPDLFGFPESAGTATAVVRIFGAAAIAYSLFTRYKLGVFRLIPFGAHLKADFVWGLLLTSTPWLLNFAGEGPAVWGVHVSAGIIGMLVPVISVPLRRPLTTEAPQNT